MYQLLPYHYGTDTAPSTLPQEVLTNRSTPGISLFAQDLSQLGPLSRGTKTQ